MAVISLGSGVWSIQTIPNISTDWDTGIQQILDFLTTVRDSLGVLVDPATSLFVQNDMEFNNYGLTEVGSIQLASLGGTLTGGGNARKLYAVGSDLYFTSGAGSAVKITNGSSLNVAATGALTGDYGSGNEQLRYDTINDRYQMFSDYAGDKYGETKTGDILLAKKNVASSNTITLKVPAGLASNYTVTLPTAVPAEKQVLVMNTSGTLEYANASGVVAYLEATDLQGTTIASASSIIAGTYVSTPQGDIRHGDSSISIPATQAVPINTYTTKAAAGAGPDYVLFWTHSDAVNVDYLNFPIPLQIGDRIKGAKVHCRVTSATAGIISAELLELDVTSGTGTVTSKSNDVANTNSTNCQAITLTGVTNTTIATGKYYVVRVTLSASATVKQIFGCEVTYDRIA